MLLSEHQSKELLARYGLPVPRGRPASTPDEAGERCKAIDARNTWSRHRFPPVAAGLQAGSDSPPLRRRSPERRAAELCPKVVDGVIMRRFEFA